MFFLAWFGRQKANNYPNLNVTEWIDNSNTQSIS